MNVCFLMDPWDRIDPETDSTLLLIHECARRGHTVATLTPSGLTIRESVVYGFCKMLKRMKVPERVQRFAQQVELRKVKLPMGGFDCIFWRKNPPIDNLALNFLDSVKQDTFIINDLEGLRIANNKLYPAYLFGSEPDSCFIPATHVSKNKEYLESVLNDCEQDKMILKPLVGFGGRGVIVIEKRARQNFRSLLDYYIGDGEASSYVVLQEYVSGAEQGDVRILMLKGEPLGAMRRVPSTGDLRSNIHAGGTAVRHQPTREERELCRSIGPRLVNDGLYLVGIDVIGGKLIEVNVLSPGGIVRINRLNRVRLQRKIIDFVEQVVTSSQLTVQRKTALRRAIDEVDTI
jgi:glutathione synthase